MTAYKDSKNGSWYIQFQYKTWNGDVKRTTKRGFKTKRDALQWERDFLVRQSGSAEMRFDQFVEQYKEDISARIRSTTLEGKMDTIRLHILPYFGNMQLNEIGSKEVMQWQNKILKLRKGHGQMPYKKSYLKRLHCQLSAIFNHAVKYYQLPENPAKKVGNMGSDQDIQMSFWTLSEYQRFSESMMEKPLSFYAFEVLYWCGLRLGEMLALTVDDVDLKKGTISINKTYHRKNGKDIINPPKTTKSMREVKMPAFLCEELKEYVGSMYQLKSTDRLFPIGRGYMYFEMKRGIKEQELRRIRIHDLRHSHVSLLIDMGYSAVAIADRLGHESIDITYRYAHMFPNVQTEMADNLNALKEVR